jgi:hypothetical protein
MKKGFLFLAILICAGLFLTSGVLIAAKIPDEIIIDGQSYKKDIKGPVNFSHKKHFKDYKVKCTECHHDYKDGENVWKAGKPVKKCEECHDPAKSEGNVKKLMLAYHKNCQECHKEKAAEGIKTPDKKKCADCHQEKSK